MTENSLRILLLIDFRDLISRGSEHLRDLHRRDDRYLEDLGCHGQSAGIVNDRFSIFDMLRDEFTLDITFEKDGIRRK